MVVDVVDVVVVDVDGGGADLPTFSLITLPGATWVGCPSGLGRSRGWVE